MILLAGVVAVLALGVAYLVLPGAQRAGPVPLGSGATTAPVVRRDLQVGGTLAGTLGFGAPNPIPIRARGTVTWLPPAGSVIERGEPIIRLDDRPVSLLFGDLPAFRSLGAPARQQNSSREAPAERQVGRDVAQLERNLSVLGYGGFDVDEEFTAGTAAAVRAWQRDLGRPETGRVEFGDVVYLKGPIRVAVDQSALGLEVAPTAVQQTSARLTVSARADGADVGWAERGRAVSVTLPDQRVVRAEVVRVESGPGAGPEGASGAQVTIRIRLLGRVAPEQAGEVLVNYVTARADDVLAVPVTALVALAEGGYAVQLAGGAYVPVTPGLYAEGLVEVVGELDVGTEIRIPA